MRTFIASLKHASPEPCNGIAKEEGNSEFKGTPQIANDPFNLHRSCLAAFVLQFPE